MQKLVFQLENITQKKKLLLKIEFKTGGAYCVIPILKNVFLISAKDMNFFITKFEIISNCFLYYSIDVKI